MKKLCCIAAIVATTLTGCASAPALDAQGNYVSPNHTFSVNVPADVHTLNASTNTSPPHFEYVDFGSGSMSGLEVFQGGTQSIEWIPADSPMITGAYMHSKHSAADMLNQYKRYLTINNNFSSFNVQHTSVKTVNGHTAYEVEGTAKQGSFDVKVISTAVIMPTATANITSILSITNSTFTGKAFDAQYQKLVANHQHLVRTVQPL